MKQEHKLYIVEGADGTGKSTLCNALMEKTKGNLLHATYDKDWSIPEYHTDMAAVAIRLMKYQDVIMDRWAVSEEVYANAFRGGAEYSADDFMKRVLGSYGITNTVFVYCTTDNIVENHEANKKIRAEMFDDMSPVVKSYEDYMASTKIDWLRYDFNKVNMNEFVEEITHGA